MVFAPTEFLGLGLQHIHTTQEILRIKDILNHTFRNSTTGQLYKTSIELFFIEAGMGTSFLLVPKSVNTLLSLSLIKSTWEFLLEHQITLDHDITYPPQRENDAVIMQEFLQQGATVEELMKLNMC
jgi:hypothetical protein